MTHRRIGFHQVTEHHVADFNSLDALIEHARGEGATYADTHGTPYLVWFPRDDGRYDEARAYKKDGYFHLQGPSDRRVVGGPPPLARRIGSSPRTAEVREAPIVRDYIAVDRNDRRVAGPFKSHGEAAGHVPPGGYVKFKSGRGAPRGAPPAPSSYPMFRANRKVAATARVRSVMATHIDPDTYSVYNYDTGDRLEGTPTEELVRESLAAGYTGAVLAVYDADEAQWGYVPSSDRSRVERRGETVRTVYVMED